MKVLPLVILVFYETTLSTSNVFCFVTFGILFFNKYFEEIIASASKILGLIVMDNARMSNNNSHLKTLFYS